MRGAAADYDEWAELTGDKSWSYDHVLPLFRRMEDNARGADRFHGVGGPLRVEDLRSPHPWTRAVVQSAVAAGYPRNDDFNGAAPRGRRPVPGHAAARPSLVVGRRLPAPRGAPSQPDRADRGAHHPGARRERPGHRRRVPLRRAGAHRARHPRGRAVRRRDQLPAAADALGHRAGRPPAGGGRRRRPRPARGRRRAAGPPARADGLQRAIGQVAAPGRDAAQPGEVEGRRARPADLQPRRGGAVHPLVRRAVRARPAVPLPAGEVLEAGGDRSGRRGLQHPRRAGARALARLGAAALGRPDVGAGHRRRLPHRRARPRRAGVRRREGPGDRRDGAARLGAGRRVVAGRHGARSRRPARHA